MNNQARDFAIACTDMNSINELESALELGPDVHDMRDWSIGAVEWAESIKLAIHSLRHDLAIA